MKTPLEILESTKTLLSNPTHWGRKHYNRVKADGTSCYCLVGGVRWVCSSAGYTFANFDATLAVIEKALGFKDEREKITDWNDNPSTQHADVLSALDSAIELAEETND
jgi:hypothetical protein